VNSYEEARHLIVTEAFELVLSVIPPRENAISTLAELLAGTQASVFYAHPVEDSCWWLPALRNGLQCLGAPALRPGEVTSLLDQLVEEIRERRASLREPRASSACLQIQQVARTAAVEPFTQRNRLDVGCVKD
jgi:hypothetical protein